MSPKTDLEGPEPQPEFSNEYLFSLVGATAIVLIMIFVVAPMASHPLHMRGAMPYLYAWVLAGGVTISNGLTEFGGRAPEILEPTVFISVLISLLVVGVIAPTLTLKLMRSRSAGPAPQGSRAFYLFGLIIAATFAISVVPTGFISWRVGLSLREAQSVQRNKDLMINDLNVVAMRVREYRILPKRLGGGEGSTAGFTLSEDLSSTAQATYAITASGDQVIVKGTSKLYEGCELTTTINAAGWMTNWDYTGRFR